MVRSSMTRARASLRPRRPEDSDGLAAILEEQRPTSRYPFLWPLPMPVKDFIYRDSDASSWVAELDGRLAGHVSVGTVTDDDYGRVFTEALGVEAGRLRTISALFTSTDARGHGVGSTLLTLAEGFILERGLIPVLDVLPAHATALALYRRRGWHEVARNRPSWLPDAAPDVIYMALSRN